ncbi:Six-hairpin glycosidase-like protein [Xylariales sp. PMI_506]|nr:Six-hairpin glycosidase-like protein [Xylariales sp. PMI_506]
MDPENLHSCLHYTSPAAEWTQALPIGNGRLGCMVHGRTATEVLQLNEDSVWYGGPQDRTPRAAAQHLPRLRELIRAGRHREAEQLARDEFFASPSSMRHYEPLGQAYLEFEDDSSDGSDRGGSVGGEKVQDYRRWLDINSAVTSTSYTTASGVSVTRDAIASYPDGVVALRIKSSRQIRFRAKLSRRGEIEWDTTEFLDSVSARTDGSSPDANGRIVMRAVPGGRDSNELCCVLGARCAPGSGVVRASGTCLVVEATECLIVIGAQTSYRHADPERETSSNVSRALQYTWDELLERHVRDYRELFNRTNLRFWPDSSETPTDVRLSKRDPLDAGLVALYHNYGRYLLIASSRDGPKALPANLQGIWSPSFSPPWGCKFTININTQMNYWPAGLCGLTECFLPLVDLLERMAERGKRTARLMYGCDGWCAHHNADIWADTDPQDTWMPATLWPLGGLWICVDAMIMLEHQYDRHLHERLHPVLKGCIVFLRDFLIPSEDGEYLVTCPSLSPENTYISKSGELGIFCEGSVMDMSIVQAALRLYIQSADKLSDDDTVLREDAACMLARIAPIQVNKDGLIQEWGLGDFEEHEPGHRHVSHLFGLHPGDQIRPRSSPRLAEAARRVLARRAAHGGGHTGWSRAWLLNMHARLEDAEGCGEHMELLLSRSTLPNLLDNHPPFQIDGNFGGCAGIIECILQSSYVQTDGAEGLVVISLFPACPKEWQARGRIFGIRVRGGWEISFEWREGQILDPVQVQGGTCVVLYHIQSQRAPHRITQVGRRQSPLALLPFRQPRRQPGGHSTTATTTDDDHDDNDHDKTTTWPEAPPCASLRITTTTINNNTAQPPISWIPVHDQANSTTLAYARDQIYWEGNYQHNQQPPFIELTGADNIPKAAATNDTFAAVPEPPIPAPPTTIRILRFPRLLIGKQLVTTAFEESGGQKAGRYPVAHFGHRIANIVLTQA